MRNPASVLNSLTEHSTQSDYKFERLYRVLFNEEMFYLAYQRIYAKQGNMTEGSDGKTIDEMSLARIEKLIGSLRDETYQPNPARRTYIPKKNGKMRPLGIPSFDDKLVQEVIRMVLEAIFERQFENSSHGFRPQRSCHTALRQVQLNFTATKWFIEGDIEGFFDNINHDVLIGILKERIEDERFLRLIRKFLNAGYLEDWVYHKTYSGTPQGGIVSPVLANIYLDKLDKYMQDYILQFNKGDRRRDNVEYHRLSRRKAKLAYKMENIKVETERAERIRKIKEIELQRYQLPCYDEMDSGFKRIKYVRYADDFLIGVIGSNEDSVKIKEDIKNFLHEKLKLTLSDEKTLITHGNQSVKFLGYEIYVRKENGEAKRGKLSGMVRQVYGNRIVLKLPLEVMRKKLLEYEAMHIMKVEDYQKWKPQSRIKLINNDDLEILDCYNTEIRGFGNYYSIANNSSALNHFKFIMKYSMFKTFAKKYRMSGRKVMEKLRFNKDFAVRYTNKQGEQKMRLFFNGSFSRKIKNLGSTCNNIPSTVVLTSSTSLIDRLKAKRCELCGAEDNLEMHHVRRLKDLKGKEKWEILMIARRRKTMAVCSSCHKKIHFGKID